MRDNQSQVGSKIGANRSEMFPPDSDDDMEVERRLNVRRTS